MFDGHGGKEAAEFARQNLCQHILEQDDFWSNSSDENENDQMILSAIRKGFLACHNDMWNHVGKWTKTSSGLPSTSGNVGIRRDSTERQHAFLQVARRVSYSYEEINCIWVTWEIQPLFWVKVTHCTKAGQPID